MSNKTFMAAIVLSIILISLVAGTQVVKTAKANLKIITVPDDYPKIQAAIDNATDGDTVYVRAGVYVEAVIVDKAITLKGEDKGLTIIHGLSVQTTVLVHRDGVTVTGFTIDDGPDTLSTTHTRGGLAGIHLLNVQNCKVYDNEVVDSHYGIWLYQSSGNNVFDNVLENNENGIMIDHSTDNAITGNTASNGAYGIQLSESSGNTLRNNSMVKNTAGFVVSGTEVISYFNDVDATNMVNGKKVYYLTNQNNVVVTPSLYPNPGFLALINCTGITVQNCSLADENCGIFLFNNSNSTVTQNTLTDNQIGIWLKLSSNCTVSANIIKSSKTNFNTGIEVEHSNNTHIVRNSLNEIGSYGIQIISANDNWIAQNTLTNCDGYAIRLDSSSNNVITTNQLTDNRLNIDLSSSSDNRIESNKIAGTNYGGGGEGISINGYRNIIAGNTIVNQSDCGIALTISYYNEIVENNLIANNVGLGFEFAFNNKINGNNITESKQFTITLAASTGSIFFNNNFITNQTQIDDSAYHKPLASNSENFWTNGTIGNYWSNYNGTDANLNGVGDTPYVIDSRNADKYPLMSPFIAPAISPSPLPTETPSPSASPVETQQPTQEPAPSAKPTPFGDAFYGPNLLPLIIGTIAVMIAAIAGVLVYFKKRNPHTQQPEERRGK